MIKIAVLGDGILGSELLRSLNYKSFSRKKSNFDIDDDDLIIKIIKEHKIIINCIANTDSYSKDYKKHWKINYLFPKKLTDLTKKYKKKLVHISTEYVYANNDNLPNEKDEPIPNLSYYTISKLLADNYIKYNLKDFLICRCLHKEKGLKYDKVWDISTTGDSVDKIAEIIIDLIEKNAKGIFNIGTGYKHLSKIIKGEKIIKAPSKVPKSIKMDLSKLKNFLNENN